MKYFNQQSFLKVSILMREKAKEAITQRHLQRLKTCKTQKDRTISSKIRWTEFEEMALEFNKLSQNFSDNLKYK